MRCAKGIFAKGSLGGTGFSLLRWEKGSETPSCDGEIRHFPPQKFQCFSSQSALHGLRALDMCVCVSEAEMPLRLMK